MKIVDLSLALDENTPVYPGDPPVEILSVSTLSEDGFNDSKLVFGSHLGTHIDAPAHMIAGGKTLDIFQIETFRGNGICIDVRNGFDIQLIEDSAIKDGDIVILYTGMTDKLGSESYFSESPEIPKSFAQELVDRNIKILGMDMSSPDTEPFAVHKLLLSNDILIIENLTSVSELVGSKFTVCALPIKVGIDGAPARVIAEVEE